MNALSVRYYQFHDGVRVFGGEARVTVLENGAYVGSAQIVEKLDVETKPSITLAEAVATAARHLLVTGTPVTLDSELLILPKDESGAGKDLLVWTFLIASDDEPQTVKPQRAWVNAITGELRGTVDAAPHGKPTYHGPLRVRPNQVRLH